jgi:hypothetical protein
MADQTIASKQDEFQQWHEEWLNTDADPRQATARGGMMNVLPENDGERGDILLATCLLDYFPNACAAVARHSAKSNAKHNPGQPPHWARDKSTDHRNKIARHLIDAGGFDKDGNRHSVAIAWRGLALLEDELIAEGAVPGRNAVGSPSSKAALAELVAESQRLGLYDDGIPAESAYLASFSPNGSRIATPAEIDGLRDVLSAEELKGFGIGDVEPRHVMQAEADQLSGPEDRL